MGALSSLATLGLELALAHKAREEREDELQDRRRQEIRRIRAAEAEEQRRQQAALARRLAQERARAGAAGVASSGGSIDAVLRGLEEEARALRDARSRETAARIASVRERYEARGRRSLLDTAAHFGELGVRAAGGLGSARRSLLD